MTTGIWVGELDVTAEEGPRGVIGGAKATDHRARLLLRAGKEVLGFAEAPLENRHIPGASLDALLAQAAAAVDGPTPPLASVEPMTVVVCTRERAEILGDCLDRLAALDYALFEVLVVDNAPVSDATRRIVERYTARDPRFRYTVEPRPGLSRARNHGLRVARTRIVAFTDDDVLVDRWWLQGIARGFARSAAVGCVTGLVPAAELREPGQVYFDERYSWSARLEARLFDLDAHRDDSPLYPFSAGLFGTGANFAVDRFVMLAAGGFDEALGAGTRAKGGEDLDAFVRLLHHGAAIAYEPSALVWHRHRTGTEEQRDQLRGYGVGLAAFITKCLVDPTTRWSVLRAAPRGVGALVRAWRSAPSSPEGRVAPVRAEGLGLLRGPVAYARGRYPSLGLHASDAAVPVALGLWFLATTRINAEAMTSWGLLPALPVIFFVAVVLLLVSATRLLSASALSTPRLTAHLIALVLMIHATAPLVLEGPIYAWLYKHVGVIAFVGNHGLLDPSIDIYHRWPGFFALAAWFTSLTGARDATAFAAWAPVFFNLIACLQLSFVFRTLGVADRVRWLALFLFVAGNWVGQDYLAPQALAFVLGLAVLGLVLARFGRRGSDDRPVAAAAVVYVVFSAVVVTHQLSPLVIVIAVGLLTLTRIVRPWWVVVGLAAIAGTYIAWHFEYLSSTQDLLAPLGDPIRNLFGQQNDSVPVRGRRITALGAPALVLWLIGLAFIGMLRRRHAGEPLRALVILLVAPVLIAFGQNYGGEVVFRIYLFTLPWLAVLAASAWDGAWPAQRWRTAGVGVSLGVAVGLLGLTFFGGLELYRVRPGEADASRFFYANAEPGSLLALAAPNFPTRIASNYSEFFVGGENPPNFLTAIEELRHREFSPADAARIARFVRDKTPEGEAGYLALSRGQTDFAEITGMVPRGALDRLAQHLRRSSEWSMFYSNPDATLFRLDPARPVAETGTTERRTPPIASVPAPLSAAIALSGLGVVLAAARARRGRNAPLLSRQSVDPMVPKEPALTNPSTDAIGRIAALTQLDARSPESAASLRAIAVDDLSPAVRTAALEALGAADEMSQLAALRDGLADPQPSVRIAALTHLPVAMQPAGARLVFEALADADEAVRQAACRCAAGADEWLFWLALRATTDRGELVAAARETLGEARLAALVATRAQSPDPDDRRIAVAVAGLLGGRTAEDAVLASLLDPDPTARLAAIRALNGQMGAVDALLDRLATDPDPLVRLAALDAVREWEDDRVILALADAVSDEDPDVAGLAVEGLRRHNSPGLAKHLGGRLEAANAAGIGALLLQLGPSGEEVLLDRLGGDDEALAATIATIALGTAVETRARAAAQGLDPERRERATRALARLMTSDADRDLTPYPVAPLPTSS